MIAVIDYGMGNLRSVQKALEKVGAKATITQHADEITRAQKVVLPGVGAIKAAMDKLESLQLIESIKTALASKKPFLGICLGLQLLFEESNEGGVVKGLGIFTGKVTRFTDLKVPHMGWNQIAVQQKTCPLFKGIAADSNVYFCHSYYVLPRANDVVAATTDYGTVFASAIWKNNIFGVQFHPEKSQDIGLKILKNFTELKS